MRHSFLSTMKASLRSLMLAVAMILPLTMMAAGTKPSTGSGSASSPYEISSAANLVWFRDAVNGVNTGTGTGVSICAKLTADISLSGVTWSPIGTSSKKYTGTFDGNGKKITNMSLAYTSTYSGFFGYIDGATIKDFSLAGTMTSSTSHSGGDDGDGCVVGRANGASTISGVTCSVNLTLSQNSQKHIGGIVGGIYGSSSVEKCTYSGTLNVYNSSDCIGGIVGFATAACTGSIKNCLFSGKIITTSTGSPYLGGILGYTNDESKNFGGVQNCLSYGTFTYGDGATTTYVHGIVGRIRNYATTTKNNRYLNTTCTGACNTDGPSIPDTNTSVTLAQCKTGEVAWALNGSTSGTIWRQNLEGTKDNYPTLDQSHGRVYYIQPYTCNATAVGNMIYSNSSSKHTHYDVTVKADNTSSGTGTVTQEISTTNNHCYLKLTATPDEHSKFYIWKQGNSTYQSNPWTVEITGATTITYAFGYKLYAIDAKVNDSNMGSVTGAGSYFYNTETDLMATPKAGYMFDYWSDGTTKYSGKPWTENRNVLNQKVTGPATYTAYFKAIYSSYDVTTKVNDSNMGTATGGGTYVEGTSVTLTATPKTGYEFNYWSDGTTKYNGTTASNGVNTLVITVSKKVTYTAYFKAKKYTITLGKTTNGTVSQTNANGVYDYNTKAVLTATPNAGYDFEKWQDGNKDNPRTITVTKSDTYTASFTKHINYYDITVSVNNADYGTVTGGGNFAEGTQVTLTATPKKGYRVKNWLVDNVEFTGKSQSNGSNKLTLTVSKNVSCVAVFEKEKKSYAVLSSDNVLTFYYDDVNRTAMGSTVYSLNVGSNKPVWYSKNADLTKVVFDASFADARPTSCYWWFYNCSKLTTIEGISYLNTSYVTNMHSMFYKCSNLTALDVSNFNTENVTNMNSMFYYCSNLTALDVSKFNTENVTNMYGMFCNCSKLTALDVSNFNTGKVENMRLMFYYCSNLTALDVSKFNTENVTDMNSMFCSCPKLTTLDVSKFNTGKVTDINSMFAGCSNLTALDVSKFNTENVTNMGCMFDNCSNLTALDVSKFNTENVTSMLSMFDYCSNLTALDVSNFNTEKVTNMNHMFSRCSNLTALDVCNFNTEKVTDMAGMFARCSNLTALDVSNFNTEKVTDMEGMFRYCQNLTALDVSNFNTEKVTDMRDMFEECSNLTALTIGNFDMQKATYTTGMFTACNNLNTLNITYVSPNLKAGTFDTFFNTTGKTVRYVLNDNSIVTTSAGSNIPTITAAASYTRVPENRWGTLIVPFDIKITGDEEFELYEVTGTRTFVNQEHDYPTIITRLYGAGETIPANMPVFIHYSGSFENDIHVNACNLSITPPNNISAIVNVDLIGEVLFYGTYGEDLTDENGVTYRAPYNLNESDFFLFDNLAHNNAALSNIVYALPFRAFINFANPCRDDYNYISNISFLTADTVQVLTDIVLGKRKKLVGIETDYNNDGKVSIGDVTSLVNSLKTPTLSDNYGYSPKDFIYNGKNYRGVIAQ